MSEEALRAFVVVAGADAWDRLDKAIEASSNGSWSMATASAAIDGVTVLCVGAHLDHVPLVRCGMCGNRATWAGHRWIECDRCSWSSYDPHRVGWLWRLRVWLGR
jgi:hypothetical protein